MPPIRLPGTDRIIFLNNHIGDVVIDYSEYPEVDDAIKYEDVRVVGDWVDYYNSGTRGEQEVMRQGVEQIAPSSLRGEITSPELELTDRGNREATTRQRPKLLYINLDKK